MPKHRLREKLQSGEIVLGLMNMYPASGIIEGMCKGWDFVWVDGQHGQHSYESILHACQTADGVGVDVVIRVPAYDSRFMGNYADLAPSALLVPMVNTVDQAHRIVDATRFPPFGNRSYGGRRVVDVAGRDYYTEPGLLVIAQIETTEGLKNAGDIIGVDGIDALFIGTDDMKIQMGIPVGTRVMEHEALVDAMVGTASAAKNAGKHSGCICGNTEDLDQIVELGYRMIVAGADIGFLRSGANRQLEEFRKATLPRSEKK